MSHIFDNIRQLEACAEQCRKDQRQYVVMREAETDASFIRAHTQVMDHNSEELDKMVKSLRLDNPAQMIRFIKAIKALGAVEALERIQDGEEFSNWVNLGLESWINRIGAEAQDEHI